MSDPIIRLTLPWPPGVNHAVIHGRNGSYKSTRFKAYKAEVDMMVAPALGINFPVYLSAKFYRPNDRAHDLDGLLKYTIDPLVWLGILTDDGHKVVQGFKDVWHAGKDKINPRVEVEVYRI